MLESRGKPTPLEVVMPSPFPGMDPYLEDPGGWVAFHNRLIGTLDEVLSAGLGPAFFVAQQTAVYLIEPEGERHQPPIVPDVFVADLAGQLALPDGQVITPPVVVLARYPARVEQRFLEIRDMQDRKVIAVIEVLSPTNKEGSGARQFDRERREVMTTPVHWVEIDLLRAGVRFPPAVGRGDYCVTLKRGDQPLGEDETPFLIWGVTVREPLPTIAVPLTPRVPALPVDLQAVFTLVYERYYQGRVGYGGEAPPPPFPPETARWVAEQVRRRRATDTPNGTGQ
jgi:hypothetical protein